MLYRPLALTAHTGVRSFIARRSLATTHNPFPGGDDPTLNSLLGVSDGEGSTSAVWGSGGAVPLDDDNDPRLANPPIGPKGSLPPRSAPAPRAHPKETAQRHALPSSEGESGMWHLHVRASRNNTILTLTNPTHHPKGWVSAGLCGFKKVQRSGYEAGYQCAVHMFAKIVKMKETTPHGAFTLEIAFNGFGFGREAVFRALMASEGENVRDVVVQLKDTTPLKIGGTKAKKARRL